MALPSCSELVWLPLAGLRDGLFVLGVMIYGAGALFALTGVAGAVWAGHTVRRGRARRARALVLGVVALALAGPAAWMAVTLANERDATWTIVYWSTLAVALFGASVFALTSRAPR